MHGDCNSPHQEPLRPITLPEFSQLLRLSQRTFAVFVTAKRCPICGPAEREAEAAAVLLRPEIEIFRVDADKEKPLVLALRLKAVPSLLVFTSGVEVMTLLGFYSRDELHTRLRSGISTEADS